MMYVSMIHLFGHWILTGTHKYASAHTYYSIYEFSVGTILFFALAPLILNYQEL